MVATNTVYVLLSFEGPDPYARVGGLATRVSGLAEALAEAGSETHLFFVGDPDAPGEEARCEGRLILHRWCQWISKWHPGGVYDGEEPKVADLSRSAPAWVAEHVAVPATAAGRRVVVISEEWQTAQAACDISELLSGLGLGEQTECLWNANHTYGFDRIDWQRLTATNRITTVSRYMRGELLRRGIEAEVVPNGIPKRLLRPVPRDQAETVRSAADKDILFFKMARWAPDKGWSQALQAIRSLRSAGQDAALVARGGGDEQYGNEMLRLARDLGLKVVEVAAASGEHTADDLQHVREADVLVLRGFVNEALGRGLYAAADGVLANSRFEPFGLVGLETMAAGGVAYTGATGEEYALPGYNAVVLATEAPDEIVDQAAHLREHPAQATALRRAARQSAAAFTWGAVAERLERSVQPRVAAAS